MVAQAHNVHLAHQNNNKVHLITSYMGGGITHLVCLEFKFNCLSSISYHYFMFLIQIYFPSINR